MEAHAAKAKYLFQQDKFYDVSYDTGDKSVQCGRKIDGLKVWTMWKAKGDQKMESDIDNMFDCSRYTSIQLKSFLFYNVWLKYQNGRLYCHRSSRLI